jgi:hypothetical protein
LGERGECDGSDQVALIERDDHAEAPAIACMPAGFTGALA